MMRVQKMVQRLGTPQVALRLNKEELCLSLTAVGKLLGSTSDETMLRQRALQVLPMCSSRELVMIAGAIPTFGWTQAAFVEAVGSRAHLFARDMGMDDVAQLALMYAAGRWASYSATAEQMALTSHAAVSGKRSDVDSPAITLMCAAVLVCTVDRYTVDAPLSQEVSFANPLIKAVASDIGRLTDAGVVSALCGCALLLWCGGTSTDRKTLESGCKLLVRRTVEALRKTEGKRHLRLRPSPATRIWAASVARTVLNDSETAASLLFGVSEEYATIGSLSVDPVACALGSVGGEYLRANGHFVDELAPMSFPLTHPLSLSVMNVLVSTSVIRGAAEREDLSAFVQLVSSPPSASEMARSSLFRVASVNARALPDPSAAEIATALESATRQDVKDIAAEESIGKLLAKWVASGGHAADPNTAQRVHAAIQVYPYPDIRAATAPVDTAAAGAVQTMSIPAQMMHRRNHGEAVRDDLLMEVLESVEDYTPAELAMCVYAIPDKCVEFDMLLERIHSGIPELTIEPVALLIKACTECAQLSEVLLGDLLAQTAETVANANTDAHLLIGPLCDALFSPHVPADHHEDIVTFVEAGAANFMLVLSRASPSNICAFLVAFRRTPGLLRDAFGPCCTHLSSLVPTLDVLECAAVMKAVGTVDVVHHRLVDAVSARLKELFSKDSVNPDAVCAFIEASVMLDVPDLDTLLQSSVMMLTNPEVLPQLRPALLPSLLRGCVYMRHTALTQRCVDTLSESIDSLRGPEISDVCDLLCSTGRIELTGADFAGLATKVISRCGALLEECEGGSLRLPVVFGGIRRALSTSSGPKPCIPSALSDAVAERVDAMSGSDVADILASTVGLSLSGLEGLLQATLSRLAADPASCTPTQLSDAIFAAGESGLVGGHVAHHIAVDSLSDYCVDNEHKWRSGASIARLVYGFSRVQCTKRSLYNVFATRLRMRPILHTLRQADISVVMSGFGNAKYLDKILFDRLAKKVEELSPQLQAADLAMVLSGYSRMNLLNDSLYTRLGERVAEVSSELPPAVSVRLLQAYGHVGVKHDTMAGSLVSSLCSKLEALDANKAAHALFALCEMDHEADDAQMDKLATHIADRIDEVDATGIMHLCEVMQDLNWRHERLLVAVGNQSAELQLTGNNGGISAHVSRNVLDTLGTFMIHHPVARQHLTEAARSISRDESVVAELEYNKQQGSSALEE